MEIFSNVEKVHLLSTAHCPVLTETLLKISPIIPFSKDIVQEKCTDMPQRQSAFCLSVNAEATHWSTGV